MAIRIKARAGESAEQMLRRFKKMCEKEGLTKDVKRRAYYEKPSERKQRALRKSIKRAQQLAGIIPMSGPPGRGGNSGPPGTGGPGGNRMGGRSQGGPNKKGPPPRNGRRPAGR
ncbi:MAG: 30S ribosomal protein S21 [Planctomycetes bacterium]|nr:30S ribosomal protein S21 [Planctomycetota bacterium]